MLRKIDRVILRVPNVAAAAAYYRDVLQVPVLRLEAHVAAFALPGGGELILLDDPDQPFEQVYFLVDDVCDLYRRRAELKLTFTQPPRKVARGYRATVKDPLGTVLLILDRTADLAEAIEDGKPPEGLFAGTEPDATAKPAVLVKLYEELGRTADHLLNLRKSGKLPKLGQAPTPPPKVSDDATALLRQLIGQHAGPFLGKRDRLPYTEEFDAIVNAFNAKQAKPLSPHLIWRLVARLAK